MRTRTLVLLAGIGAVVGAGAALGAAALLDVVRDEGPEYHAPEVGRTFPLGRQTDDAGDETTPLDGTAAAASEPGALVEPVEVDPPDPFGLLAVSAGGSAGAPTSPAGPTGATSPTTRRSSAGAGTTGPAGAGTTTTTRPGGAPGLVVTSVLRFFDLCALPSPPAGCPQGVPGTVLYTATAAPKPPPLQIKAWPDATVTIFPTLRCDPGYPTLTELPVVVTSNQPLAGLDVTLRTHVDGKLLYKGTNLRQSSFEETWYRDRVAEGRTFATGIGDGLHTCLSLKAWAEGSSLPRHDTMVLKVTARAQGSTSKATVSVVFNPVNSGQRPPVTIFPLDPYRAGVSVPHEVGWSTQVWVLRHNDRTKNPGPCPAAPPSDPQVALAGYADADPEDLAAPGYPYYRHFKRYAIWNLDLEEASVYSVCVAWNGPDGRRRRLEHWWVNTPNTMRFQVTASRLYYRQPVRRGGLDVNVFGAEGCFLDTPFGGVLPAQDLQPDGDYLGDNVWNLTNTYVCDSRGRYVEGSVGVFEARVPGDRLAWGVLRVPVKLWYEAGEAPEPALREQTVTALLAWYNPYVLCGGWRCESRPYYGLELHVWLYDGPNNGTGPDGSTMFKASTYWNPVLVRVELA